MKWTLNHQLVLSEKNEQVESVWNCYVIPIVNACKYRWPHRFRCRYLYEKDISVTKLVKGYAAHNQKWAWLVKDKTAGAKEDLAGAGKRGQKHRRAKGPCAIDMRKQRAAESSRQSHTKKWTPSPMHFVPQISGFWMVSTNNIFVITVSFLIPKQNF